MGHNETTTGRARRAIALVAIGALAVAMLTASSASAAKSKAVPLATAATWVAVGPDLNLQPGPSGQSSTTAAKDMMVEALVKRLALKGAAYQSFARTAADPADPSRLVGNYIVKVFVFKDADDAEKFRKADVEQVLGYNALKKVGTYHGGDVLDDTQGHINVMYTIGNVAVDVRTGVAEKGAGSGVIDAKKVADAVYANSKEKSSTSS